MAWVEEPMRPQGSLEDGPKPEKAGTSEFHNRGDRIQGEMKTNCKKFQLTELERPVGSDRVSLGPLTTSMMML